MMTTNYSQIAKRTALVSFGIGTFILLSYLIFQQEALQALGFIYLILISIYNLILLLVLLIRMILYKEGQFEIFKSILLMLLNIPVAYLYIYIGLN